MDSKDDRPKIIEAFHDEYEMKANDLYKEYYKEQSSPELLLRASREMVKSSNPESKQMSSFFTALYFREKASKEKNNTKAAKYLDESLKEFRKYLLPTDDILKNIKLELLKRKLMGENKEPKSKSFLRRAELFKELGKENEYNLEMCLYYMFEISQSLRLMEDSELLKNLDQMMTHAQKVTNEEFIYKAKSFDHQVRGSITLNPKERIKELKKSLEFIKKTSDRFGEDSTETEISMARAMSTADPKKRSALLAALIKDYKKRGFKQREHFVKNLMVPIPISAAKVIFLCDKSVEKVRPLEKKLSRLKKSEKPTAVFYHTGYLIERINDVRRLMVRMAETRKELTNLQIKINSITPTKITSGKPDSKRLQEVFRKSGLLKQQMRQDMESLLIYGNLLLDQWSYIISYISGHEVPKELKSGEKDFNNFAGLLERLQTKGYSGVLTDFWNLHRKDIIWLNFHLRGYRNVFVEHMRKPWQRGITMETYGDDFRFHIPSPVGYIKDKEKKKLLQEVYKLAPQRLKDMPDDYWEKKNLHRALEITLYYIDELEKQSDRDYVWKVWHKLGGSAPSYDRVGFRLLNYVFTSLDTISKFIDKHPKLVKYGEFG